MHGQAVAFVVANTRRSSERERQFGVLRPLSRAAANDPKLVPSQIADALSHVLVIYLIAVEVASAA